ncbi:MAG: AAA family ATPase [Magnetococcales bacterium]|nr:AAA family ATPase [Magnetococcales bacterium]
MIIGITIRNFKSIREVVSLRLSNFHVLVGANGSGKSTFLDALHFVRDCLDVGPLQAVEKRSIPDFNDLTFMRRGGEIQMEFWFDGASLLESQKENLLHYKVSIGKDERLGISWREESLNQYSKSWQQKGAPFTFSAQVKPRRLLGKTSKGTDFYQRENGRYQDSFVFGMDKSTLSLTPPDSERYPTANAVKQFLMQGIRYIQLNSASMRLPCPATRGTGLELDGTNLARVVGHQQKICTMVPTLTHWTEHLRYALPSLQEIAWDRREADNAEFLVLKYDNGLECPSWLTSDGTLRMLALTLPAFLPGQSGIYMVEEPENGVHPKGLEIIFRALSTIPDAQVLVATHSPLVVQQADLEQLLCFSATSDGSCIMAGPDHPRLKEWDRTTPDLAAIFSAGILG